VAHLDRAQVILWSTKKEYEQVQYVATVERIIHGDDCALNADATEHNSQQQLNQSFSLLYLAANSGWLLLY
jgi:hypothetical protein